MALCRQDAQMQQRLLKIRSPSLDMIFPCLSGIRRSGRYQKIRYAITANVRPMATYPLRRERLDTIDSSRVPASL